jgi:hypothetical protein
MIGLAAEPKRLIRVTALPWAWPTFSLAKLDQEASERRVDDLHDRSHPVRTKGPKPGPSCSAPADQGLVRNTKAASQA